MNETEIKALLQAQLPKLIAQDPTIRDFIARAMSDYYAGKQETESRFDQMVRLIQKESEEGRRRWEEHLASYEIDRQEFREQFSNLDRKIDLIDHKIDEQTHKLDQKIDEQTVRLDQKIDSVADRLDQKIDEQTIRLDQKIDGIDQKIDEQTIRLDQKIDSVADRLDQKIDEQTVRLDQKIDSVADRLDQKIDEQTIRLDQKIDSVADRLDQKIDHVERRVERSEETLKTGFGAIGARWGTNSEASFRNGLKAILEGSFGIEVINFSAFDQEGIVFNRPDQVEIDVIIKNGTVILLELKSSISKSEMSEFDRKVAYYEKYQRKVDRKMVISPMVHPKALSLADELGIEVYSFADEVKAI